MSRGRCLGAACAAMFVFGIVLAILGVLFGLPEMRSRLGINLAQQGDVLFALMFGVFVSTILVGPVIDTFGHKVVLLLSAVLSAIALPMLAFAHSLSTAFAVAAFLGFAGGGLNTAANALIADIYPENRGAMLNVVGVFFCVGAICVPVMTAFTIDQLLIIAASLSALCAIYCAIVRFPPRLERVGFSLLASVRAASIPGVMIFGLILFCQSGNEQSISGWTSTYVWSSGATARAATWVIAGYWIAMMMGRILAPLMLKVISPAALIITCAIGTAIGCAALLLAYFATGAIIIGFSVAPIYPTVLAMAADRYGRMAGTIFGFLFAIGLIGGMAFPLAVGHIAQGSGMRAGMTLPMIGAVVITALTARMRTATSPA